MLCLSSLTFAAEEESTSTPPTTEDEKYLAKAKAIWNSLDRQKGEIKIEAANAILKVPEDFYYLNSKAAKKILVDVWGNPPGQTTLGMLFPSNQTPFDNDSWAVTIEYEEDGYVSDEDADEIDYNDLLSQMKKDTRNASKARIDSGYEAIELVGWASSPYYDSNEKKLHWAKEIKFGEQEANTLNYNIRVLGRKGVLILNFIAGMDQKETINSNIETVLSIAEFDTGSQYSDFNPSMDKVAAYGLGALVAGKVIAKTGLIAIALLFLKKFGIFIFIGLGIFLKRSFSKKET